MLRRHWAGWRFVCATIVSMASVKVEASAGEVSVRVLILAKADRSPMEGVTVRMRNLDTSTTRTHLTDVQGQVRFFGLETAGRWVVEPESPTGYGPVRSDIIVLRSGFDPSVTLLLPSDSPESVSEYDVTVSESRGRRLLNASNAEVSSTLRQEDIQTIPVEGRSLDRVLFRLPFVTRSVGFFPEAPSVAINGANSLFTNYMVDGLDNNENFLGGMRFPVPIGMVQDVTVLASNYSVEYGRTANGIVNVTTRSGGNDWKGEAYFVTRPGLVANLDNDFPQSDLQGNPVNSDFQRYQFAGVVSGPIIENKTFFFANAEYTIDLVNNQLTSPQLGVDETIHGNNQSVLLTGKVDHVWNEDWRTTIRVNHGRVFNEEPGGGITGGVTFPSAASEQERLSTNAALTTTYSGDEWSYTGALQYARFDWDYRRAINGPGPQTALLDPSGTNIAVLGHPGFVFDEYENNYQTQHKMEVQLGAHRLKFGFDVIVADFSLLGGGNADGNALVQLSDSQLADLRNRNVGSALAPGDIQGGTVLSNVFETRTDTFGTNQQIYSLFAEDQIQLSSSVTLNVGVRWEYDSLSTANGVASGDFNNFAPRVGFNWAVLPNVVVRGGTGLFYEKIPYAVVSDAIQFSNDSDGFRDQLRQLQGRGAIRSDVNVDDLVSRGNYAVESVGPNGEQLCTGADDCSAQRASLTSNELRIQNPNGLQNPFAVQSTLGAQWKVVRDWLASVDFVYSEGFDLVRLIDLNAPQPFQFNQALFDELGEEGVAALSQQEREDLGLVRSQASANSTRPVPVLPGGARSIIVSDTGGRSRYRAVNVSVYRERLSDFWDLSMTYTLSRLENDTDDINFRASDSNNFAQDFGPSLNDRTHILSTIITLFPLRGLAFTIAGLLQSGAPINFVPDAQTFGTTDLNGDGLSFADQFTGNPDRFPGDGRNSGRLDWSFNLDLGLQYAFRIVEAELIFRADVFNVLNLNNQSGYPVNFTASNQIQLGGGGQFVQRSSDIPLTAQFTVAGRI
jgi:hypothetical protein